jgi:hypothetical protein
MVAAPPHLLQVAVENFAGPELAYELLEGTWKLEYTTALDVLPLINAELLRGPLGPLLEVRAAVGGAAVGQGRRGALTPSASSCGTPVLGRLRRPVQAAPAVCSSCQPHGAPACLRPGLPAPPRTRISPTPKAARCRATGHRPRAPPQVGDIYQRFSSVERGWVENIIRLSVPLLLEARQGVTFTVGARCGLQQEVARHGAAHTCVARQPPRLGSSGSEQPAAPEIFWLQSAADMGRPARRCAAPPPPFPNKIQTPTARSYEVMSPHRIALTFRQAEVGQLKISPGLEALLAPAMMPRGFANFQLLQALKEVSCAGDGDVQVLVVYHTRGYS